MGAAEHLPLRRGPRPGHHIRRVCRGNQRLAAGRSWKLTDTSNSPSFDNMHEG